MGKTLFLIVFVSLFLTSCITANIPGEQGKDPNWVNKWISEKQIQPVENPPASISRCIYKDETVYFIPSECCDNYSNLYNKDNKIICAPSGGITGHGDGRCTDFSLDKNNCELIWRDSRSK